MRQVKSENNAQLPMPARKMPMVGISALTDVEAAGAISGAPERAVKMY